MPIHPLPSSAAQVLNSTLVLSDVCSVVKELLDNALDASASSISIEISQNTVDVVQVKDNGHGISPEDHSLVCMRSFTSKIQTLEDLRNIGGQPLGFRGQALASACEIAGSLTVSTKTAAQMVGSRLTYDRAGELVKTERFSHPVGTTVRITSLLKYVPVRKQVALKDASRTITKIRKLLQVYAIARHSTRLSLRVLGNNSENHNWAYSPKPTASLTEAALIVAGSIITAHCFCKEWPILVANEDLGYKLIALLPKTDADFSKISSDLGQLLSVDARPVSSSKGTLKGITKLFKSYIRSAARARGVTGSISDPFICLDIKCPNGSYDANIEPAKDDVLFTDSQAILSLAEGLFKHVYGEPNHGSRNARHASTALPNNDGCNLLLTRSATKELTTPSKSMEQPARTSMLPSPSASAARFMVERSQLKLNDIGGASQARDAITPTSLNVMNPWIIAKMAAAARLPREVNLYEHVADQAMARICEQRAPQSPMPVMNPTQEAAKGVYLPSPSNSDSPSSPGGLQSSPLGHLPQRGEFISLLSLGTKSADTPSKEQHAGRELQMQIHRTALSPNKSSGTDPFRRGQNVRASCKSLGRLENHKILCKPFKIPRNPERTVSSARQNLASGKDPEDHRDFEAAMTHRSGHIFGQLPSFLHRQVENPELEKALEFERRKKAAIVSRRELTRQRQDALENTVNSSKSPHLSRYLAARAALAPAVPGCAQMPRDFGGKSSITEGLNPDDPRAYFIRRQLLNSQNQPSLAGLKIKRIQTSKLPLEKIPNDQGLHNLALNLVVSLKSLSRLFQQLLRADTYVQSRSEYESFFISNLENVSKTWEDRLAILIQEKYRSKESPNGIPKVPLDLYATFRSRFEERVET